MGKGEFASGSAPDHLVGLFPSIDIKYFQWPSSSAKHTAAHTRRSKRRITYVMGILRARRWPWKYLISLIGNKPTKWSEPEPDADSPFPPRSSSQQNGNSPPPCTPPRHQSPPSPPPLITTDQLRRPHPHQGERARLPPETLDLEIMATLASMDT